MARPPVIGIVGGIGSGKSAVAALLREEGCVVSDSDALAHAALRDPRVRDEIVSWWGRDVLDAQGAIDRSKVGHIVFADSSKRRRLEALVHPWIGARRESAFAQATPGTKALVIDAPLLLEAGLGASCDAVIFVDAPRDIRVGRVRAAHGWDEGELGKREAAQWDLDRKRRASTHVIPNDGSIDALRERLRELLVALASRRNKPA